MANLSKLINKSTTIDDKAKEIAEDIVRRYRMGEIESEQDLLYEVSTTLEDFYESIGKPIFSPRLGRGVPLSENYNKNLKEILSDIKVIVTESQNLTEVLKESYTQIELDRQLLENMTNLLEKKIEVARFKLENEGSRGVFVDNFIGMESVDESACELAPSTVNTDFGYVSLATKSNENINSKASVKIHDDSNGFPGNTHCAHSAGGEIKFEGEDNLHIQVTDTIDNNSDTWLDYEVFRVSDEVLRDTLNLGFEYHEGLRWIIGANDKLRLSLQISFDDLEVINNIALAPFIASAKDASPAIIKRIIISDGKGNVNTLGANELFSTNKVYSFPKQLCKTIVIEIEQDLAYETTIGHLYYREINNQNANPFEVMDLSLNKIVDGPMPSIKSLGIVYDEDTQRYNQLEYRFGQAFDNEDKSKTALFQLPNVNGGRLPQFQLLNADRFHIGVRGISMASISYRSESELVSKELETERPINSVSLEVTDFIPESFDPEVDWIEYFFSVDNTENWLPIIPEGGIKNNGYSYYLVNSGTPAELRRSDFGYVELESEVYKIRFKAVMRRPVGVLDSQYYSPILFEYKLKTN